MSSATSSGRSTRSRSSPTAAASASCRRTPGSRSAGATARRSRSTSRRVFGAAQHRASTRRERSGSTRRSAASSSTTAASVDYDYLVIATGPELAFDEIEGLGPEANTQSVCQIDHALKAKTAVDALVANPGPVVIGAVQGASCFGPAYEFAFILDKALRDAKVRDRVPMTFVTSEPYIGHLGLDGVGDTKGLLESELRQHHIKWIMQRPRRQGRGRADARRGDRRGRLGQAAPMSCPRSSRCCCRRSAASRRCAASRG